MYRFLKSLAIIALIILFVALYRAWVERNKLPLFIPLGFFENAMQVKTPEEQARDPDNWSDPITPIVRTDEEFESLARNAGATERTVDVLVTGATFGGMSAAISAAENGVSVALISETEWQSELLTNAMQYVTDDVTTNVPFSNIERRLQQWKSSSVYLDAEKRTILPLDVVEFFDNTARSTSLVILESHFISAFGRDRYGRINRALVQTNDGSSASVMRFSYIIDGTLDGSAMALAGADTKTGWDTYEETGEPNTISADAATAIAEGYTMSGRTVLGIGRRLDGALMNLAVIDRGYHGVFARPTSMDDCWGSDKTPTAPFILEGTVYKAKKMECATTTVIQPTFDDTVEVFYINHGADSVSATITIGSGPSFNITARGNPRDEFIRVGAFPASSSSPLSITVRSSSSADRFEGFILRKMNVNSVPITVQNYDDESMSFASEQWKQTAYDAYVRTKASTPPTLQIDDVSHRTEQVGTDTFIARNIVVSAGKHTLYRTNGSDYVILIPQRPHREIIPISERSKTENEIVWEFTATANGTVALLAPSNACERSCEISLTAQNAPTPTLREVIHNLPNAIYSNAPVGVVTIRAGTVYTIKAGRGYDPSNPPLVALLDKSSELYAVGTKDVAIFPPAGGMYDVWVRSLRSEKTAVKIGKRNFVEEGVGEWHNIATEVLSSDGISFLEGGAVEIMAIPNTLTDVYAVKLEKKGVPANIRDVPPGSYSLKSFGIQNPTIINVVTEESDVIPLEFIEDGNSYISRKEYAIDGLRNTLNLTTPWAQKVFLYEGIHSTFFDVQNDKVRLIPIVPSSQLSKHRDPKGANVARTSSGTFLLDPYPLGIGPVTIGNLNTDEHRNYVRDMMNNAYMILRMGKMHVTKNLLAGCTVSTPTCDPRRLERAMNIYGTVDALPPLPHYPDTRRLAGLDTFTYDQAYTTEPACTACTANVPTNSVLSFRTYVYPTTIVSPAEERLSTLPILLHSLRRDKIMSTNGTHLEYQEPLRDASLTLGMFISANEPNVLSGNSTLSATHIASRSIRSPRVQMAIGSVAGLSTAFAMQEFSDVQFVAQSTDAIARLQQYLVRREITVMPLFEPMDDPLLLQAMQQRILDSKISLRSAWVSDRLSFIPTKNEGEDEDISLLQLVLFGNDPVVDIRDALMVLDDAPQNPTDLELLSFGLSKKIITPRMFQFSLDEILRIPLDEELLIKIQYLLQKEE